MSAPERLTTAELLAMIDSGAKREDLPTKANGRSVTSTRESATSAYERQLDRIAKTEQFKKAQKTLTAEKYFTPKKNIVARELIRQRESLISAGVKGTSLDLRTDKAVNVDTTKNLIPDLTINVVPTRPAKIDFSDSTKYKVHGKTSKPIDNQYQYYDNQNIQSVSYDSDINNPASVTNEEVITNEELIEHAKTISIGTGVAIAGGIIIYLMSKGKLI